MLAIEDGALGLWNAISRAWRSTRHQRCWAHKTADVPNHISSTAHGAAKGLLHGIWMSEGSEPHLRGH